MLTAQAISSYLPNYVFVEDVNEYKQIWEHDEEGYKVQVNVITGEIVEL